MILEKIQLIGFKNYEQAEAEFSHKFNCFTGNNGMGKTNMLDAIYYLSFCKSFYNPADNQNIKKEAPFFLIQGFYEIDEEHFEVYCGLKRNEKKQFKWNKKEYQRLSDHIGMIPLVMIAPEDAELIHGGSEVRRKFIDGVISQYNKKYLEELIKYNRVLLQRNAMLKAFYEKSYFDIQAIEIYDEQLSASGNFIFSERINFFNKFNAIFNNTYYKLTSAHEQVKMVLQSALHENNMEELLTKSLEKDKLSHYTNVGIHKDDLIFEIEGAAVKKFASQGQQKTFLVALKLAQYAFIAEIKSKKPILLLDDVYDKLDESRLNSMMQYISDDAFGQIFITDTHRQRMSEAIGATQKQAVYFTIENGSLISR